MLLTLPAHVLVLAVVFAAVTVGLPALTRWETRRAYRHATTLLDTWGLPAADRLHDARHVHHASENEDRRQDEVRPVLGEGDQHDDQHQLHADQRHPHPLTPGHHRHATRR